MLINQDKFKGIMVSLKILFTIHLVTVMEGAHSLPNMYQTLWRLKICQVFKTSSTILKKTHMHPMWKNHLVKVIQDNTIGHSKLMVETWNSVFQALVSKTQRICSIQPEEHMTMNVTSKICTGRPMATSHQENKRIETTTGSSTLLNIVSVMVKRKSWMELQWLFIMRDKKNSSLKLSLLKRLLKTRKQLLLICLEFPRT